MSEHSLKIALAEPSIILRSGLVSALKRLTGFHMQIFEMGSIDLLPNYIRLHKPDILIINPIYWGNIDVSKLKIECNHLSLKCIGYISTNNDESLYRQYDETVNIFDNIEKIKSKFDKLIDNKSKEILDETETLSNREKEILKCVVKGLTNKDIAKELFVSTHTVISHRRNIARKLEIHSTAGLTIYAILNKLIELDEIKVG